MRMIGHGKAKMKPHAIAHRRITNRDIGMHPIRRLHIGEGRNNHPPNAFNRVERQQALVAFRQRAHHGCLAARAKRGA